MTGEPTLSAFERHRVLLLNADYRPLGFPLLTLTAPQVIAALMMDRVSLVRLSDVVAHSPRLAMRLPSVVALKRFVDVPGLRSVPACNRFNLFVRDRGMCQYSGVELSFRSQDRLKVATIDHVVPVWRGGVTRWDNCVLASMQANMLKGGRRLEDAGMQLLHDPWVPHGSDLLHLWLSEARLSQLDQAWVEFLAVPPSGRLLRVLEKMPDKRAA